MVQFHFKGQNKEALMQYLKWSTTDLG